MEKSLRVKSLVFTLLPSDSLDYVPRVGTISVSHLDWLARNKSFSKILSIGIHERCAFSTIQAVYTVEQRKVATSNLEVVVMIRLDIDAKRKHQCSNQAQELSRVRNAGWLRPRDVERPYTPKRNTIAMDSIVQGRSVLNASADHPQDRSNDKVPNSCALYIVLQHFGCSTEASRTTPSASTI